MTEDNFLTKAPMRRGDAIQKAARGWHLRVIGRTWAQIADEVGYANPANAHRAVSRFAGSAPDPELTMLKKLWRERMEHLYSLAARDAEEARPGALRAGVAIAQRAAALDGLDTLQRVELAVDTSELNAMVHALLVTSSVALEADVFDDAEVVDAELVNDGGDD